jgi:P4 family phage/plasmid primase-like protien
MLVKPDHYEQLTKGSAIAPALIQQRGYQSLPQPEDLIDRGFSKAQARTAPALGIPLWDVHGQRHGWQIRPDHPRQLPSGKIFKYELAKDDHLIVDVHPSVQPLLGDPTMPLWITEGIKKGDALVSQGLCTIALIGGVWGFRGTNEHGGKVILPDWEYVALNDREVIVAFDSDITTKPNVCAAMKALWHLLRSKHARPASVRWPEAFQQEKWGVDDFLARGHTLDELRAMVPPMGPLPHTPPHGSRNGHHPASGGEAEPFLPYSDYTNARAFVQEHGAILRYCYPWKTWLVWTGTHWQRDTSGAVIRLAKQTVKRLARQVEQLDEPQAGALLAHIKSSLSMAKLKALVECAQSEDGIAVQPEALDQDPWLLNCADGTLDLRTGTLRRHQQADLLTKCLAIPYKADATCPMWDAFLWRIMGGSQGLDNPDMSVGELEARQRADDRARALIDYLRETAGYSLTGSTREQCMFLCHGPTKTGKSTYLATMRALTGPYGTQTDIQTFMHKDRPEIRNDLADLAGARYVYAVESQEGKRLADGLVKQLTGGADAVKARFLFQEYFEFKPQFKVYIGTNHLPKVKEDDEAIWERIKRIPFTVQIPKAERDLDLDTKLLVELPGILAWAVQGCLAWQKRGRLQEPQPVLDATQEYRAEMDDIGRFLSEVCILGSSDTYKIQATTLLHAFHRWIGNSTMTGKALNAALTDKGYTAKRANTGNFWLGIGLPASEVTK